MQSAAACTTGWPLLCRHRPALHRMESCISTTQCWMPGGTSLGLEISRCGERGNVLGNRKIGIRTAVTRDLKSGGFAAALQKARGGDFAVSQMEKNEL